MVGLLMSDFAEQVAAASAATPQVRVIGSDDTRRVVHIGGVAVGVVTAREILLDGTIVYEVDPFPMWRMAPHPREEIR